MHLSPSSISTWARLGAATADAAASHTEEGTSTSSSHIPSSTLAGTSGADSGCPVSAKLAEACLSAAEKHAKFSLLAKARDAGSGGSGGGGGGTGGEVAAKEVAATLSGIAKAVMCGGGGGGGGEGASKKKKSKDGVGVRASSRSVRATSRAVHLYPGDTLAWRCLATALVSVQHACTCVLFSSAVVPRAWSLLEALLPCCCWFHYALFSGECWLNTFARRSTPLEEQVSVYSTDGHDIVCTYIGVTLLLEKLPVLHAALLRQRIEQSNRDVTGRGT